MKPLSPWQAPMLRAVGALVSPGASHGALLVLIYHRVLVEPDPLLPGEPDAAAFAMQMDLLKSLCQVLPLGEGVERLLTGKLPRRAACITFDDGYANNRTVAAPILAARGLPATVFVASGFLGSGRMWNDTVIESVRRAGAELDLRSLGLLRYPLPDLAARRNGIDQILVALKYRDLEDRSAAAATIAERVGCELPEDLMMTELQIKELASFGMEVGAHTIGHPILARLDAESAWREVSGSKRMLEDITGTPVAAFAYPNGTPGRDYQRLHVDMVRKAGFRVAVSAAWGAAGRHVDPLQVPRVLPWETSGLRFAARLLVSYRQQRTAVA